MKFNIYIVILLIAVSSASCADFLTEEPTTEPSGAMYNYEAGLETAITGCYQSMQSGGGAWQKSMFEFVQPASGLICWRGARTTEHWMQTMRLTMLPQNSINTQVFEHFYASVNVCNTLIEQLHLETNPVNQTFKNEIEGEARLIRAINYFALVRLYGDVPLVTVPPKNLQQANNAPRASYMRVYEQILEDLEFAETWMRTPERQVELNGAGTRPHRWAATSMKAAVYAQIACLIENKEYMFFDYEKKPEKLPDFSFINTVDGTPLETAADAWKLCLASAQSVIESNVYQLADSYADLFIWGRGSSAYTLKERVFVLTCTNNTSCSYMTVRSMPEWPGGTENVSTTNKNWGRIRPSRFVLTKWAEVHGGIKWTDRVDRLENMYKGCRDPRYDLSYWHTTYPRKKTDWKIWPSDNNANALNSTDWYLPFFKKYFDPHFDVTNGYADFYLMRYAEVILYAAEAAASLSSAPGDAYWNKAMDYMEEIHARARRSIEGGSEYPRMSDWGTLSSSRELVDAIMWERVFEMNGENHEFFDTHRRGARWMAQWLTIPLNKFNALPEQNFKRYSSSLTFFEQHYGGYVFEERVDKLRKAVTLAYPDKDIRNNTALSASDVNDFYYENLNN